MNNKKGFTLVELLAVIVVLAIIIAIAVPTYSRIQKRIERSQYENKIELLKVAAAKYSEDTHIEYFFVEDLINYGYIDADKKINGEDVIVDQNNHSINCYIMHVTQKEGNMYYAEDPKADESVACDTENLNAKYSKFTVLIANENGPVTKETDYWSNKDITLTPNLKDGTLKEVRWYKNYYSGDPDATTTGANPYSVSTDSVLKEMYKVTAVDTDDNEHNISVPVQIDKITPKFYDNDRTNKADADGSSGGKWVQSVIYKPKTYDNESGILGHYLLEDTTDNCKGSCSTDRSCYVKDFAYKFYGSVDGMPIQSSYTLCVMDKAGNLNTESTTIDTSHIDSTEVSSSLTFEGTLGSNGWYKGGDDLNNLKSVVVRNTTGNVGASGMKLEIIKNGAVVSTSNPEYLTTKNSSITYTVSSDTPNAGDTYIAKSSNKTGASKQDTKVLKYERDFAKPTYNKNTPGFTSLTVLYNVTNPVSLVGSANCKLNGTNNKGTYNAANKTCTYNVSASENNTNYTVELCITSNAGNTRCSGATTVTNTGYCNDVSYSDGTKCTDACGGTKNRIAYSKNYKPNNTAPRCPAKDASSGGSACGGKKWKAGAWGGYSACSNACGAGTKSRSRTVSCVSSDESKSCSSCSGTKPATSESAACNPGTWASQTSTCSASCGGGKYLVNYYSNQDNRLCSSSYSGGACNNGPCCTTKTYHVENTGTHCNNAALSWSITPTWVTDDIDLSSYGTLNVHTSYADNADGGLVGRCYIDIDSIGDTGPSHEAARSGQWDDAINVSGYGGVHTIRFLTLGTATDEGWCLAGTTYCDFTVSYCP